MVDKDVQYYIIVSFLHNTQDSCDKLVAVVFTG